MKKIFTLFAALAMVMSMSAVPYLKGAFNGWGESNSLQSGSTDVTLNANATYEFKVNDGNTWYGNNGTMTSTNCTDWTMSSSAGNCKIKTTIAGVYTFKWNASSKKLSVVYPTEAVEINYYITGSGNLVGGDGWKANEIKMTNNDGTYTYTFTNLAAGNYEMKITQGNWDNTLGFSNLATSYVGVTGNNDNNIIMALADATNLTVTVTGTTVSLSLPEKTNTIYFVNEKGWAKVNAYVWTDNPYKPWPGEAMTKVEGKTYGGKDVYTYTYPANNSKVIFNDGASNQTGDLTYSEATPYYYNEKWNASIAYDKAKYNVNVTAENGTVTGAGEYEEGKTATLTATPAEGYQFVNWTKGEEVVSTENPYSFVVTADVALVANFEEAAPEYALEETVEIANLTTETLTVGEATYLQLTGRNDMLDSDVQLFLNNYTGEDKEYEVNVENSLMTFGGIELTVVEGKIAQATDPEKGKVYTGRVIASAEEEGEVMLVALDLVMYATPAVEVAIADATARVDEETGSLVLNAEWTKDGVTYPVFVTVAGYEEGKEVYEGAQISELQIGDDDNWLDFAVANTVTVAQDGQNISVEGEYTSWATGTAYALTISGKLPVVEPEVITYELNGGEFPAVVVPTNEELAMAFKQEYAEYFAIEGLTDTDMNREVGNFIYVTNSKGGDAVKFITENANWKWLADYIISVAAAIPEGTNVGYYWRANIDAFFHCKNAVAVGGVNSADFSEAGKPENWGAAYEAAHAVVLPTEPVAEDYVLPTPVKEGYTFVGWYDNAEGTGKAYTVIPAGWAGTLYAIWKQGTTTALENIAVEGKAVKAIINGQLIIIKNGVQYNAQGAILK